MPAAAAPSRPAAIPWQSAAACGRTATTAWSSAAVTDLTAIHGYHEALGALGLAEALELLRGGMARRVLVLSGGPRDALAVLLARLQKA